MKDISALILVVFFAVSGMIVARVIINKHKRQRELSNKEEVRKEQEKLADNAVEDSRKQAGVEANAKENADDKVRKEPELEEIKPEEEKTYQAERRLGGEKRPKIPPVQRGGRPRGVANQNATKTPPELKSRPLRPEIICWHIGWKWIVGIEVPEEFASPQVTQNNESLEQDTSNESNYYLKDIEGTVKVAWTEGEKDIPIVEEGRNYLIFKMRKDWKGKGRLVRRPTAGYYLIVTPQEWNRYEETSGPAPVAPENVQINGYKAHFFVLEQNEDTTITFIDAKGERIQVETGSSRFQLVGKEISDSFEDMGPLFGEEPPRIKAIDEQEWDNVGVVVIGEEGSGRNRWRTKFVPKIGTKEQKMPDELTNQQGGWYFVRIYDKNNDLLESMDFRFMAGLKDIQIMNSKCLPEPDGYNDVTVQFIHQANCKVEPADEEMHHVLTIRRENDFTIATIPPKPDYDKTHWVLGEENAKVKTTVLVKRVWWCVGRLGAVPANWTDKADSLSRKNFTAITDKALWVRFPHKRWISNIKVGFNRAKSRSYSVEVEKEEIEVPLRDFCDAEEFQNPIPECLLRLFIDFQDKTYSVPLLRILAYFRCKKCSEFLTNSEKKALLHIERHLSELIPHLRYEELYQIFSDELPFKIYKCNYCNFYVPSDDPRNPTSTIVSHIVYDCQKAEREFGLPKIIFNIVSDLDEIRKNVIANLPHIYRCQMCGKEFHGDDWNLRLNHLQDKHKNEIFEIF